MLGRHRSTNYRELGRTAISVGDLALPIQACSAMGDAVDHVLGWCHLSIRAYRIEQVTRSLCALEPPPLARLGHAQIDLGRIANWAKDAIMLNGAVIEEKARRLVARSRMPTSQTTRPR